MAPWRWKPRSGGVRRPALTPVTLVSGLVPDQVSAPRGHTPSPGPEESHDCLANPVVQPRALAVA